MSGPDSLLIEIAFDAFLGCFLELLFVKHNVRNPAVDRELVVQFREILRHDTLQVFG